MSHAHGEHNDASATVSQGDLERERELKAQMSMRVKQFYDVHGRRPAPQDIQRSSSWFEIYKEIGVLRAKRKQASPQESQPHARETSGKKQKVEERIEMVTLPDPLPSPPEGFKEKKNEEGRLPVAAALHLCFPDKFPTFTSAKRAARRGGDPRVFRVEGAGTSPRDEEQCSSTNDLSIRPDALQKSGSALICKDCVGAGEQLMFVYKPPKQAKDASALKAHLSGCTEAKLKVLIEDPHLAVVVKPPSLLSHWQPGCSGDVKSLLSASLSSVGGDEEKDVDESPRLKEEVAPPHARDDERNKSSMEAEDNDEDADVLTSEMRKEGPWKASPCHRLDVGTGGVLLIAKTRNVAANICEQFAQRRVEKMYMAVVVGKVEGEGSIDTELQGRRARTRYMSMRSVPSLVFGHLSLLKLIPETGRMHQLRKHMAGMGTPILGDRKYRTNSHSDEAGALFLWACSIAFDHPVEGRRVRVHEDPPNKFLSILSKEEKRWTRVKLKESQGNVPPP